MMITLTLDELLAWTDEERGKWETWCAARPDALAIPLKGGRFGTVGGLIGHIFEAEWRQSHRLTGEAVPERVDPANAPARLIFDRGRASRLAFRTAVAKVAEAAWPELLAFDTASGRISVTKRKLALHLPLHEIRHWAQIARTVREHDLAPPGKHDLMFSEAVR
jgi:uncharacterized damage-inducible protein DinB